MSTLDLFIFQEPGETFDLEILAVTGQGLTPDIWSQGWRGGGGGRGNESPGPRGAGA